MVEKNMKDRNAIIPIRISVFPDANPNEFEWYVLLLAIYCLFDRINPCVT